MLFWSQSVIRFINVKLKIRNCLLLIESISKFLNPYLLVDFLQNIVCFSAQFHNNINSKCLRSHSAILTSNRDELFSHVLEFYTHAKTARLPLRQCLEMRL